MIEERRNGVVSVIVPVFNRAGLVAGAIDSILAQTYQSAEVIVVDDGSTDGTGEVVARYAAQYPDRIRVITQSNAGQTIARNRGICAAKGAYIAFLDSDDTWMPSKLELQMPLFRANIGLVFCAIHEVDETGNIIRTVACERDLRGRIYDRLLVRNRMTGGSVVVTRKALDMVGLFDETLRAAENWDLWIRISKEFDADFVNEPLVSYLKHDSNISRDETRMREATWTVLRKHFPHAPDPNSPLHGAYLEAYASFYYNWGVSNFSEGKHVEARQKFRNCWKFLPGYRDSRVRFLRSFLGTPGNAMLSGLAAKLREHGLRGGAGGLESGTAIEARGLLREPKRSMNAMSDGVGHPPPGKRGFAPGNGNPIGGKVGARRVS